MRGSNFPYFSKPNYNYLNPTKTRRYKPDPNLTFATRTHHYVGHSSQTNLSSKRLRRQF